jgi:hypothetical protein
MMSCTASVAWSRPASSPCYTKHGQRCGVILSGHITTVVMSRSGQLDLRCTAEPNCSGISARACRRLGNTRLCFRHMRAQLRAWGS